jgi:hypothetical protein
VFGFAAYEPVIEADTGGSSPYRGRVYVAANQDDDGDSGLTVSRSADGGRSWKTVVVLPGQGMHGHPDLAIAADGAVYLSYVRCTNWDGSTCTRDPADVDVVRSVDGGVTWSPPVRATSVILPRGINYTFGKLLHTQDQLNNIASMAVDGSSGPFAGRLYVTVMTRIGALLRVEAFFSNDRGDTWSGPMFPARPEATNDQFMPSIAVSASGTVGVLWLDRRDDPTNLRYQAYSADSSDGGATFAKDQPLATASSNPRRSGFQQYMGSYDGVSWSGETLIAVWPDTRSGSAQVEVGWR